VGMYKRPGFGASQINFSDCSWRLWALGIGAALRNSKCVDYTGGWPHGVDECVWRLPPGAIMASPFGNDETRTQLSACTCMFRHCAMRSLHSWLFRPEGQCHSRGAGGDRAGPARGAESGLQGNPPYLDKKAGQQHPPAGIDRGMEVELLQLGLDTKGLKVELVRRLAEARRGEEGAQDGPRAVAVARLNGHFSLADGGNHFLSS
jgi:hypothetical protein